MSQLYELPDEPRPGRWATLAVNPMWPLLALMLGGPWIAWPWFVINAVAIGSPRRGREILLVAAAVFGTALLGFAFVVLHVRLGLSQLQVQFGWLGLTLWKVAFAYVLYMGQARTFALYEYYGGAAHNGAYVMLLAYLLRSKLDMSLPVIVQMVLL
jgi:hypothetical protein